MRRGIDSYGQNDLDIYNRYLEKYIGKAPVVMEIGVYRGGSLQMWKNYFGEGTRFIGIAITPETKEFEEGLY